MLYIDQGRIYKIVRLLLVVIRFSTYISRKPNIFDNMIAMMEKYANNLEALVDERTDQLVEEKKKTGNRFCNFF